MGEQRRRYEQRERARQHAETRRRIVDALIELHETVGASRTTVTEVARRAGVGRMTVYNHFPTEAEMVNACTSHWIARHPPRVDLTTMPLRGAIPLRVGGAHRDAGRVGLGTGLPSMVSAVGGLRPCGTPLAAAPSRLLRIRQNRGCRN